MKPIQGLFCAAALLGAAIALVNCGGGGDGGSTFGVFTTALRLTEQASTARINDGKIVLEVPEAAVAAPVDVVARSLDPQPTDPAFVKFTGVEFTPPVQLDKNATLRISYREEDIPAGATELDLTMVRLSGGMWIDVVGSTTDTNANIVSALVSRLETYGIRATINGRTRRIVNHDTWHYEYGETVGDSPKQVYKAGVASLSVTAVSQQADGSQNVSTVFEDFPAFINRPPDNNLVLRQFKDGSIRYSSASEPLSDLPPYTQLDTKAVPATWKQGDNGSLTVHVNETDITFQYTNTELETVTVPAGTFKAWRVSNTDQQSMINYTVWYAPSISGVVKFQIDSNVLGEHRNGIGVLAQAHIQTDPNGGGTGPYTSPWTGTWTGTYTEELTSGSGNITFVVNPDGRAQVSIDGVVTATGPVFLTSAPFGGAEPQLYPQVDFDVMGTPSGRFDLVTALTLGGELTGNLLSQSGHRVQFSVTRGGGGSTGGTGG
jgi:hypothetical protein